MPISPQALEAAYASAFPGGVDKKGNVRDKRAFLSYWKNKSETELRDALRKDTTSGGVYDKYRQEQGIRVDIPGSNVEVKLPPEIVDSPYYKMLPKENQAIIAYNWQVQNSQNEQKKKLFQEALDEATQQADPYWREIFSIAKDEISRTITGYKADLQSREKELLRRRQAIEQDLSSESQYLDAEQQASLAQQADQYEVQMEQLRDQMAAQGITSSTISARAKERSAKSQQGVVEGITRRSERDKRILQTTASRNLEDVAANLLNLRRTTEQAITSTVRGAEAQLGSSALSKYKSYLQGGITGALAEQKAGDILKRAGALTEQRGLSF